MTIYVIRTDKETGAYTAFCEGGSPSEISYRSKAEAIGKMAIAGHFVDVQVVDVDEANGRSD